MEIKHRIQFGCDTDELADKVLSGEKTATSSLYDYSLMNQEEIKVNELYIYTHTHIYHIFFVSLFIDGHLAWLL